MKYGNNKYEDIKIAYIGGGARCRRPVRTARA